MKFSDVVEQARALLQRTGKLTYRVLKREFALDDEALEDLREQFIVAEEVAVDKDGKMLVWVGKGSLESSVQSPASEHVQGPKSKVQRQASELGTPNSELSPVAYTPAHLAERIRAVSLSDGERKTITALFADLKGSTALIEGLDPEEARTIIDPALQLMMDAVHRYEGYVAQALGDGIFALFGAPLAHEDHPQRALYAALRMQEEMRRYATTLRAQGRAPLLLRVGVNTGEVVVRSIRKDDLHADYVPVGHSTNLAARMEQMATPGSILVTAYTHKLTAGYFEFKALGEAQIKGVEEPLKVYEVLGAGPLRTRLQVSATRGLTRFVGRHSELDQMQRALEQAKASHGQIVGVMGEPGLGKSRLFYEFKLLSVSGCLVLEAYSVSHGKASPYLPVIELLKSYFDIQPQDDERKRRERVIGKVLGLDRSLEDALPHLFALLGIEEQPSPLQQMDPQIRRKRTFDALKKLFLRESLNQPLVLIFEDLHWIDSETQGFLDVLSESVASARLLLLTNYRPEYRPEWGQKTYYTQLRLAPFGKAEAEEFLDELLGTHSSPRPFPQRGEGEFPLPGRERDRVRVETEALRQLKQLILDKTEGTPFFMEEIVQELVEQGILVRSPDVGAGLALPTEGTASSAPTAKSLTDLHIPATVHGVLAARIDRLAPEEKALLQQLAVIGREFPLSLVRQVVPQPEEELYRLLASLQRKEFLYEQPAFPEVEYLFKHALTQEVAYGTVLQEQRKLLHERTGQTLETVYTTTLPEHYSDLAHHYRRSPNTEKAITYLHLAGQQAVQRSANTEAITHLTTALELLQSLPDSPARTQQELTLHLTLGPALMITKVAGAPEVGAVYIRARALCRQMGETPQLFPVLRGLWEFYQIRGELETARELANELLTLAQRGHDSALLLEAHSAQWQTLVPLGEFVPAREHLEQGLTLYNPAQHRSNAFLYGGYDPGVSCWGYLARALWFLGYPDQALKRTYEALTLAQELAHSHSLAVALAYALMLHRFRGDGEAVQERAEAAVALYAEQGFPIWLAMGTILQGWALAERGEAEKGIAQIRQGLAAWQATGAEMYVPLFLGSLVQAYAHGGQAEAGLRVIAEALAMVEKNGERWNEAELYRLKGELTLQQVSKEQEAKSETIPRSLNPDPQDEAEACFLKAIEIAQSQKAKSWELRASTSLARLWQRQGKRTEAHKLLSQIYHWFTEGFDTKDLQEAKAVLEELN